MKRLNITIPDDVASAISCFPNKSKFITEAIEEKLGKIKREKLKKALIEGYKNSYDEDKELNEEWEKITMEGWD